MNLIIHCHSAMARRGGVQRKWFKWLLWVHFFFVSLVPAALFVPLSRSPPVRLSAITESLFVSRKVCLRKSLILLDHCHQSEQKHLKPQISKACLPIMIYRPISTILFIHNKFYLHWTFWILHLFVYHCMQTMCWPRYSPCGGDNLLQNLPFPNLNDIQETNAQSVSTPKHTQDRKSVV